MQQVRLLVTLSVPEDVGTADLACVLGDAAVDPLRLPALHLWRRRLGERRWVAAWHGTWSFRRVAAVAAFLVLLLLFLLGAAAYAPRHAACASWGCRLCAWSLGACAALGASAGLLYVLARTRLFARLFFSVRNECAFALCRTRFTKHRLHAPVPLRHFFGSELLVTLLSVRSATENHTLAVTKLPLAPMMWEAIACRVLSLLPKRECCLLIMTNPHAFDLDQYVHFFSRSGMRAFPAMNTYLLFVFVDSPRFSWEVAVEEAPFGLCVTWLKASGGLPKAELPKAELCKACDETVWGCTSHQVGAQANECRCALASE